MVDFECKSHYGIQDLLRIMELLRSPDGCPWDRTQTHQSIRRNLLEEAYEAVEAIDWQNVTVEQVRTDYPACPLPEGYTFSVQEIEYTKQGYFTVILKTDKQHWGDVTPYQAQIESLNAAVAQKDTQLTESEENLAAANAQLAELEATYDAN